ncbi:hypothetical protein L484_026918 [Morus notabilis]|uniref:Uncharacterized protein n=1 Tax=Morus notabilis TaxID=981085 RepID=W9RBJ1_9ROSA|nr:hypothetical protein L484_026918 [Morus notabilis]
MLKYPRKTRRRELCRLGRPLVRLRLYHGLRPPKGESLELNHHRRHQRRLPPDAPGFAASGRDGLYMAKMARIGGLAEEGLPATRRDLRCLPWCSETNNF